MKLSLLNRVGNRTGSLKSLVSSTKVNDKTKLLKKDADQSTSAQNNSCAKLFVPTNTPDFDWKPSFGTIFKLLFSIRVAASFWSIISDCDEVYNYWEPLHLLLFGRGFQTWEYSPVYAIRSWFYIYIHYFPAQLTRQLFVSSKVSLFFALKFLIGSVFLAAEISLFSSVSYRLGNRIGLLFIVFSMLSIGTFSASCAFLPSSFSMALNTFAMAAYLRQQWFLSILCTCISALVGWPFAAILGLPIVLEMLIVRAKQLALRFIGFSLLTAVLVLPLQFFVDSFYYGKNVVAPLNIVLYNVFTSHGPDLYGSAPASFYAKNLFLNWNVLLVFAVLSLPLSFYIFSKHKNTKNKSSPFTNRFLPVLLIFLSAVLWLTIFTLQAHKEERFLFPIFPLIALLAAIGLDACLRCPKFISYIGVFGVAVFIVLSLSRGYALHRNYAAALDSYRALNEHFADVVRVCVGKEWHRFPSSFFLPETITDKHNVKRRVEMRFLKSEFRGLLPDEFGSGSIPEITRRIPSAMNDMNLEEPSRYVPLSSCDYVVDLETFRETSVEPNYSLMTEKFTAIFRKTFLLADESHPIFRAFYIPSKYNELKFGNYVVLERIES